MNERDRKLKEKVEFLSLKKLGAAYIQKYVK